MKPNIIEYTTEVKNLYANGRMPSNCNSITFLNLGTNIANVDGIPLQQNQSLAILGNYNEINTKAYDIFFTGVGTNNLAVIRKIYTGSVEDFYYSGGRKPDMKNC